MTVSVFVVVDVEVTVAKISTGGISPISVGTMGPKIAEEPASE